MVLMATNLDIGSRDRDTEDSRHKHDLDRTSAQPKNIKKPRRAPKERPSSSDTALTKRTSRRNDLLTNDD